MKNHDIHDKALKQFSEIWDTVRIEREQCLEDRRFHSIVGAMWEQGIDGRGDAGIDLAKQFENKPKMELNKVHIAVTNTVNEYRNNRISVDFVSKDGTEDKTADVCDSLMRADQERCNAQDVYDMAYEEKAGGGFGGWRLTTEYEDESDPDNDRQRIAFVEIPDADQSIFFDLDAKRADKLDAKYAFLLTEMTTDGYRDKFDDDPTAWPKDDRWGQFEWHCKDTTFVAEYFVKEQSNETVSYYKTVQGETEKYTDAELTESKIAQLEAVQTEFSHTRKIKKPRVRKYILSGAGIIEDTGYIAGPHIPIVVDYGQRWYINGIERCMGRVRLAKDAQRVKNAQVSALLHQSSQTPNEIPIFASEQMADPVIRDSWANANINNPAYLTVNPVIDANGNVQPVGPIGYTKPPQLVPALAALLQLTDADLKEILGTNDRGDELRANVSGEAIGMIQDRVDMKDFIYLDNHAKAQKTSGKIWLGMAREVYVENGRKMKTLSELGKIGVIELGSEVLKEGAVVKQYDFTRADFEVVSSVGATFSSKRKSMLDAIRKLMGATADPQDLKILSTMAMMNIEGEGMDDIRDYARKQLVNMGVVKPTDEERQTLEEEHANKQPDANEEYLKAAAEEKRGKQIKDLAWAEQHKANAAKSEAQTDQIKLDTEIKDRESGLNMINTLTDMKQREEQASTTPAEVVSPATDQPQ